MEKYCIASGQWSTVANMLACRSNFGATVLDGMIFVVGGFNGMFTTFKFFLKDKIYKRTPDSCFFFTTRIFFKIFKLIWITTMLSCYVVSH